MANTCSTFGSFSATTVCLAAAGAAGAGATASTISTTPSPPPPPVSHGRTTADGSVDRSTTFSPPTLFGGPSRFTVFTNTLPVLSFCCCCCSSGPSSPNPSVSVLSQAVTTFSKAFGRGLFTSGRLWQVRFMSRSSCFFFGRIVRPTSSSSSSSSSSSASLSGPLLSSAAFAPAVFTALIRWPRSSSSSSTSLSSSSSTSSSSSSYSSSSPFSFLSLFELD
uniref:Putative secreted peptide n=1 Tax=Anopheles braziliensis TaxID=58242 RepID=A0A2M3ZP95_9DIPT